MKKLILGIGVFPWIIFAQSSASSVAAVVVPAAVPAGGILSWLPGGWSSIVALLIAFNLLLGGIKAILDVFPALIGADNFVAKLAGWISKIIDVIGGNVKH